MSTPKGSPSHIHIFPYRQPPIGKRERRSQAGSPPQPRTGSSARTKQTKEPAGVVPAGSDCSALSAGQERQDNRKRKLQTCALTNRTRSNFEPHPKSSS